MCVSVWESSNRSDHTKGSQDDAAVLTASESTMTTIALFAVTIICIRI